MNARFPLADGTALVSGATQPCILATERRPNIFELPAEAGGTTVVLRDLWLVNLPRRPAALAAEEGDRAALGDVTALLWFISRTIAPDAAGASSVEVWLPCARLVRLPWA